MLRSTFLFLLLAGVAMLPASALNAAGGLAGKWHFTLETTGGVREAPAVLELDGERVSGTWAGERIVKGTFKDGALELEFPYNSEEVGPGTLKFSGKLEADTITGKWSFQTYDGDFKATREQ